ncbi:MAG: glucose 1-dehydrogenase [Pseudomonadales bacterium]|nr:glucose 1-dehydrogenase [Pseudomonadales bacterium]MBO6564195.1 glucose 1-dehydrogenase [Pseudomonadales bacterium]MBO6597054.1 glucose 1-dehydrogenase [Pseudomonadales bacterium]MBO6656130.1 glucose 1-dehydrogenase [Pseudomonadales bacterium]MBO6703697.1 glucose 1-dehydrogenase [Pseudomonadales bacterium]
MFDFTGKVVLITGASYGLGEQFAYAFAEAGANLILTARSTEQLETVGKICEEKGSTVTIVPGDVSVEDDVKKVIASGIEEQGQIDVLINNAGIADPRGVCAEEFDSETFNRILSVDLVGAFYYARDCGRHMLERGSGNIVNITSILASGANENNVMGYSAAKGGLLNMTYQLGVEWADRGVRVNAVSPGFIITEMTRPMLEALGMDKWIMSRTPMRRLGEAQEVTNAVMFLASDLASYITGVDLLVDGGTNASNGTFQIPPIHHEWNEDRKMVPSSYEPVQPRPDWYQALEKGIPGLHYPIEDDG